MAETSRQNSMSGDQFFFADQERRPLHIMLIDDDKVCLTMLAHACESAGHLCETYSSPVRAMQAYNRAPEDYDVVLTDLQMPEIDGLQVLKDVRRINAGAVVILVSGCSDAVAVVAAINNRAYSFFLKPIDIGEILGTLDRVSGELAERRKAGREQDLLIKEYSKLKQKFVEAQVRLSAYETQRSARSAIRA